MIASGRYTSFQDVVIAALRELENHEAARAKVSTAGDALMTLCGRCGFIRQTRVTHPEADLFRCACPDRYIDSERPDF
jgi:Arc/MetJ-type ribon-helix-helix transcriptional regulator